MLEVEIYIYMYIYISEMCSPRQGGRVRSQGDPVSRGKRPAAQPFCLRWQLGRVSAEMQIHPRPTCGYQDRLQSTSNLQRVSRHPDAECLSWLDFDFHVAWIFATHISQKMLDVLDFVRSLHGILCWCFLMFSWIGPLKVLKRLASRADVFLEPFRPGASFLGRWTTSAFL